MYIETKDGLQELTAKLIIRHYDASGWLVAEEGEGVSGWSASIWGVLADLAGVEWELESQIDDLILAEALEWHRMNLTDFVRGYYERTGGGSFIASKHWKAGMEIGKAVRAWVSTEY